MRGSYPGVAATGYPGVAAAGYPGVATAGYPGVAAAGYPGAGAIYPGPGAGYSGVSAAEAGYAGANGVSWGDGVSGHHHHHPHHDGRAECDVACGNGFAACAEATGCGTACAAGGCVGPGAAHVTYVGAGWGDYVTETTYKYVGAGAGNLSFTAPRTYLCGRISCCLLCLLLLALLLLALFLVRPGLPSTTTGSPIIDPQRAIIGECTFWGDPHIKTFDGGRPSFYGDGEFWIVKSPDIYIQGRYMGTKYTEGLAATNKIIIGGPFLQGHTIAVGTIESGELLVDGRPVCTTFPSSYMLGSLASIEYNAQGVLVDEATSSWKRQIVHITLPMGIRVDVYRWANYLDLRITMPKGRQVDGSCGNFNGDASDDTSVAIMDRMGARVPQGQNLFGKRIDVGWTATEEKLLSMCPRDKYARAQSHCTQVFSNTATATQQKSCMLDYCWGDNHHALKMAKSMGI